MKKLLNLLIIFCCLFTAVSCNNSSSGQNGNNDNNNNNQKIYTVDLNNFEESNAEKTITFDKQTKIVTVSGEQEYEAVHAYRVGEAIKQARESMHLTQVQLEEKMGVQKSQISRLESGKSITLASMMRAFRALGVQVALEMKGIGKVAL